MASVIVKVHSTKLRFRAKAKQLDKLGTREADKAAKALRAAVRLLEEAIDCDTKGLLGMHRIFKSNQPRAK